MKFATFFTAFSIVFNVAFFIFGGGNLPYFLFLLSLNLVAVVFLVKAAQSKKLREQLKAERLELEEKI